MSVSTAVVTLANNLAVKFGMGEVGGEVINTLKATVFKGDCTNEQFTALMIVANQYGLNPFTREIYAFPDKQNGIVPVVGVDGWSRIINDHPQFDGLDFVQDDESCTCIIYRKDRNHPIKTTEYLSECLRPAFTSKNGYEVKGAWQSHPKRMLRHKALIQCARLAFGYTGIFDEDEAARIVEKDVTPESSHTTKTVDVVYYTDDDFVANEKAWKKVISNGKAPEQFIAFIESKGKKFTESQKEEILLWDKKPEVIEGEIVDDPFVSDMNKAESEKK